MFIICICILLLPSFAFAGSCNTTIAASDTFPCEMSTTSATYSLSEDVVCDTTCITLTATGVTFEGNNHTITFGNANDPGITNADFQTWSDVSTPTGWTLSSGTATRISSTWPYKTYMAELSVNAVIKSGNVTLNAGQTYNYFAHIKGSSSDSYKIGIYQVSDNAELASTTLTNDHVDRGFAMAQGYIDSDEHRYKPTEEKSVYLKIECLGSAAVKYLQIADIKPANHYGIAHHNYQGGEFPDLDVAYFGSTASNFTIQNVTIQQGAGDAVKSAGLYIRGTAHTGTITNVDINMTGRNTIGLKASPTGSLVINDVSLDTTSDTSFNRMHAPSQMILTLGANSGTAEVKNCTLLNAPEISINVAAGSPPGDTVIYPWIHHNIIRNKEQVTEGYAIGITNIKGALIEYNTIQPYLGRGIITDTSGTSTSNGLIIRYNKIFDLYEGRVFEYPATSLECAGIRIRNWAESPIDGVKVYGNQIIGSTDENGAHAIYGINISTSAPEDDIEIYDNDIQITVSGTGYWGSGIALQAAGNETGSHLIHHNTITSNYYGIQFNGNDGSNGIQNIKIYNNNIQSAVTNLVNYYTQTISSITNGGSAVDVGGGVVGIPVSGGIGIQGGRWVKITNTINYNGYFQTVATEASNRMDISTTYEAETFGSDDKIYQIDYNNDIYCNILNNTGASGYIAKYDGMFYDIKTSYNSITNSNSSGHEAWADVDESSNISWCESGTIDVTGGGSVGSASAPCQDGSANCYSTAGSRYSGPYGHLAGLASMALTGGTGSISLTGGTGSIMW